jgi:hypothetical protein
MKINQIENKDIKAKEPQRKFSRKKYTPKKTSPHQIYCLVFQQNKKETMKTLGILQPLAIPSQCWEEVSMDFITGLPKSE